MSTKTTTNGRRIGQRGNDENKSDIEVWANYLVVAALQTDAKTVIAEKEPALWKSVMETREEGVADLLALDAMLATEDAPAMLVRQIRDALFVEISQQCHEQLDPRVREVIRMLHE